MKTTNFKDWTLDSLDENFELSEILQEECKAFQKWNNLSKDMTIDDFEEKSLMKLQKPLRLY